MVNLCNIIDTSFDNYFNNLTKLGKVKQSNIDNLLILLFIDKLQRGDFLAVPNSEEKQYITKALNCLLG